MEGRPSTFTGVLKNTLGKDKSGIVEIITIFRYCLKIFITVKF